MKQLILTTLYISIRQLIILIAYIALKLKRQPKDLEVVVKIGDRLLHSLPNFLINATFSYRIPKTIGVNVHGLYFESPLVVSAFKSEFEIIDTWLKLGLGGAILKTILKHPTKGNARPRLQEVNYKNQKCLINAMGLPGQGVKEFVQYLATHPIIQDGRPIGISIGGHSTGEYHEVFDYINTHLQKLGYTNYFYELNISCPNTPDGQNITKDPYLLDPILRYMRTKTDRVISVKLSPDSTDDALLYFAKIIRQVPKTIINVGNTQSKAREDVGLTEETFTRPGGGLSGKALFPRTLEMVTLLSGQKVPLMATGGITTPEQIIQLKKAGATLFGVASLLVQNPFEVPKLNQALRQH